MGLRAVTLAMFAACLACLGCQHTETQQAQAPPKDHSPVRLLPDREFIIGDTNCFFAEPSD
jgi:hypothetical protein